MFTLTRGVNKAIMTYVLVQDSTNSNIKKEQLNEYQCKVIGGLHSQPLPKP